MENLRQLIQKIGIASTYIGLVPKTGPESWAQYAFSIQIGKGGHFFEYRLGVGHASEKPIKGEGRRVERVPHYKFEGETVFLLHPDPVQVFHCLIQDGRAGESTFSDFCADLGYSNDSISALETYRKCQDNGTKLRQALGPHYAEVLRLIEELEERGEL